MADNEYDKLEIGSGNHPTDGYLHLDINPAAPHVELVGDVRAIIAPQDGYPLSDDIKFLVPQDSETELLLFREIRLAHFVEHIHWLNQPALWKWLYQITNYGGCISIETPDLEWIVKTYLKQRQPGWWRKLLTRLHLKKEIAFPVSDHPAIDAPTYTNLSRWTAFKLFSGGSYDKTAKIHDYHLGLYDITRLSTELSENGFVPRLRRDKRHGTIVGRATKLAMKAKDTFSLDYYNH